jgi:hypothetical protein
MVDGQTETTSWEVALERLQHPAPGQNHWLATVRSDGAPHLMPIIAFWIDGAFHQVVRVNGLRRLRLSAPGAIRWSDDGRRSSGIARNVAPP